MAASKPWEPYPVLLVGPALRALHQGNESQFTKSLWQTILYIYIYIKSFRRISVISRFSLAGLKNQSRLMFLHQSFSSLEACCWPCRQTHCEKQRSKCISKKVPKRLSSTIHLLSVTLLRNHSSWRNHEMLGHSRTSGYQVLIPRTGTVWQPVRAVLLIGLRLEGWVVQQGTERCHWGLIFLKVVAPLQIKIIKLLPLTC